MGVRADPSRWQIGGRLEAAHHRWLRILHVSCSGRVPHGGQRESWSEGVGLHHQTEKAQLARMIDERRAKQVISRVPEGKGRPRKNWPETICEDFKRPNLTLTDALEDRD